MNQAFIHTIYMYVCPEIACTICAVFSINNQYDIILYTKVTLKIFFCLSIVLVNRYESISMHDSVCRLDYNIYFIVKYNVFCYINGFKYTSPLTHAQLYIYTSSIIAKTKGLLVLYLASCWLWK